MDWKISGAPRDRSAMCALLSGRRYPGNPCTSKITPKTARAIPRIGESRGVNERSKRLKPSPRRTMVPSIRATPASMATAEAVRAHGTGSLPLLVSTLRQAAHLHRWTA